LQLVKSCCFAKTNNMSWYKVVLTVSVFFSIHANAQNWNQVIKSVASIRGNGANYGSSVSISGNFAVIGAPGESTDAGGANEMSKAGAAYILENVNGNWVEIKKIVASHRSTDDNFGNSVSISDDFVAVAASSEDLDQNGNNFLNNAGAVYIFHKNQGGPNAWGLVKKLVSADRTNDDFFGNAISLNGSNLLIGALAEDHDVAGANFINLAGSAYIFNKDEGGINNWGQKTKLVASDRGASDQFGYSVNINGNRAIVGAFQEDHDEAGLNFMSNSGSVYMFELNTTTNTWGQVKKLVSPERAAGDFFGNSISQSGNTIVIAAFQEDHDISGNNFLNSSGSVYVFSQNIGGINNWGLEKKLLANTRAANDFFGRSVSIDNNTIVVGCINDDEDVEDYYIVNDAGSAFVYDRNTGGAGNWGLIKKVVPGDRGETDLYGLSVAINGSNFVVGAMFEDHDLNVTNTIPESGSAYFYKGACASFNLGISNAKVIGSQRISPVDYYNTNCEILNTISAGGIGGTNIMGHVTNTLWNDIFQSPYFVKRHFQIIPTTNLNTTTGSVTLYFTQEDFDAFNGVSQYKLPSNPTDALGKANLRVRRYNGVSSNGSGLPLSYGTAPTIQIDPSDADIVWNALLFRWEVTFYTTGFGGFLIEAPMPSTQTTGVLSSFTSCANAPSINQSINLLATYLVGNVTVSAPANYQVSTNALSGFAQTINITPASNGVINTLIYVRQLSSTVGNYSGNIQITTTNGAPITIPVSGIVNPSVNITLEPISATICIGQSTQFVTSATGVNVTYQWQIDNGIGFNNIAGANNATLPIVTPPSNNNYNGSKYRVIASGGCTPDTSNIVTLSILPTPSVTTSATALSIKPGETTTLTAIGTPIGGTYAWYKNNDNTVLSTNATYGPLNITQIGDYKVVYSNSAGCKANSFPITISGSPSNDLFVYPNPSNGVFNFRYFNFENTAAKAVVYNSLGKKVAEKQFNSGTIYGENSINISNLASGYYWLAVTNKYFEIILLKQILKN
jgi:hypothetical protein